MRDYDHRGGTGAGGRSTTEPTAAPGKRTRVGDLRPIQARRTRVQGAPEEASLPEGGGAALPDGVKQQMEGSFGADFSDVRIHQGMAASVLGAEAVTRGSDIHFAPGRFAPDQSDGRALLGHELAHVVQQRAGQVAMPQGKGGEIVSDAALEAEADRAGALAAEGRPAVIAGVAKGGSSQLKRTRQADASNGDQVWLFTEGETPQNDSTGTWTLIGPQSSGQLYSFRPAVQQPQVAVQQVAEEALSDEQIGQRVLQTLRQAMYGLQGELAAFVERYNKGQADMLGEDFPFDPSPQTNFQAGLCNKLTNCLGILLLNRFGGALRGEEIYLDVPIGLGQPVRCRLEWMQITGEQHAFLRVTPPGAEPVLLDPSIKQFLAAIENEGRPNGSFLPTGESEHNRALANDYLMPAVGTLAMFDRTLDDWLDGSRRSEKDKGEIRNQWRTARESPVKRRRALAAIEVYREGGHTLDEVLAAFQD